MGLRILGSDAGSDLGKTGVMRHEGQRSRGGRLGRDHPEGLREDRRDDGHVGERDQLREVPVLERAGEERAGRGERLQLVAVVPEAHDDGPRVEVAERLEEDVDAFVAHELAEVQNLRLVAGEEGLEPFGVPLVGEALVRVAGVRRIGAALGEQVAKRLVARQRCEQLDVDSRRDDVHPVDVPDDLVEHLAGVLGADEDRLGTLERLPPPRRQLLVPAHRILELGAVRLHGEARAARGGDGAAEDHVVREDEIGGQALAERFRVRGHVPLALVGREVLYQLCLQALVLVEHERGQEPSDVGAHDPRAAEVVQVRMRLLREDGHVVPGAAPLAREGARVDVGAGASEQIAVPEEDAHRAHLHHSRGDMAGARHRTGLVRSGGSRARRAGRPPGSTCGPRRPTGRRAAPRSS